MFVCVCCSLAVMKCVDVNIWISVICQPLRGQWGLMSDRFTAETWRENSPPIGPSIIFAPYSWSSPYCPSYNLSISRPDPPLAIWSKTVIEVRHNQTPLGSCRTPDRVNYHMPVVQFSVSFRLPRVCWLNEIHACLGTQVYEMIYEW